MEPLAGKDNAIVTDFRTRLLNWYDVHRRTLPWRAPPGTTADPYHVWLSEIMLQQTTVPAVIPYFLKFLNLWPDIHALAQAPEDQIMKEWAGLGYYARARNLHKCAKVVSSELKGLFPRAIEGLKALPGIGDYTAAAIASIAYDAPATVVDGNVERVMARYFAVTRSLPAAKPLLKAHAASLSGKRTDRPGDFAQALMDLGATVCTPKSPRCALCPLERGCEGRKQDIAATLPRRDKAGKRPYRRGYVFWIGDGNDRILLERRPAKGLLGGMTALPTSAWEENLPERPIFPNISGPFLHAGKVFHTFTHFDLELDCLYGRSTFADAPERCFWVKQASIGDYGFPSVFGKAIAVFKSVMAGS